MTLTVWPYQNIKGQISYNLIKKKCGLEKMEWGLISLSHMLHGSDMMYHVDAH